MWPNPQETADLVTFTEETLNGKLHFLRSECWSVVFKDRLQILLPSIEWIWTNQLTSISPEIIRKPIVFP